MFAGRILSAQWLRLDECDAIAAWKERPVFFITQLIASWYGQMQIYAIRQEWQMIEINHHHGYKVRIQHHPETSDDRKMALLAINYGKDKTRW